MIKYNLKCQNDHEFESWFSSSEEFEKLTKRKLLECIYCSSKKIHKSIMAPMISNSKSYYNSELSKWLESNRKLEPLKENELIARHKKETRKIIEDIFFGEL